MILMYRENKTVKKHPDTIIINGKHFNAKTGHAVDSGHASAAKARNVDGILPQHVTPVILENARNYKPLTSQVKKPVMDIVRTPAAHVPKRRAQPGQTLMRSALKKPKPTLKRTTKVLTANSKKAGVTVANLSLKMSATQVDDKKLSHSQLVSRSAKVRRFTPLSSVQPSVLSLNSVASKHTTSNQAKAATYAKRPNLDMFDLALARAVSHEQITPPHINKSLKQGSKKNRVSRLVTSSIAVLLIAGFVGYQNLPNLKFQYASGQAGFRAELPDYRPPGFSVGKLSYETGAVRVNFTSNSDSRAFSITEQPSSWDSQALRDNFFTQSNQTYKVSDVAGRTVYTYGNNNATWLNDGIWYDLKTDGSLTERQLAQIASSL